MKRFAVITVLFGAFFVFADTKLKSADVDVGAIVALNCAPDAGLLCTRDAGSVGNLRCNAATATEPGCVTPSDQAWAGKKSFTDRTRLVCKAHASLTACSSGEKGTWQTCCDHNAPVFCNGTSNTELLGATSYQEFPPIYVNGLLHSGLLYLGAWTLPYAYTITNVSGFIAAGAGTTQNLRFTDGTNNCDCTIDCTGATALTCSGNCSYAANTTVAPLITADGCTTPTTVKGLLVPEGYR